MTPLPIITAIQASQEAERIRKLDRLRLRAASGMSGAVAARREMTALMAQQLVEELRRG